MASGLKQVNVRVGDSRHSLEGAHQPVGQVGGLGQVHVVVGKVISGQQSPKNPDCCFEQVHVFIDVEVELFCHPVASFSVLILYTESIF